MYQLGYEAHTADGIGNALTQACRVRAKRDQGADKAVGCHQVTPHLPKQDRLQG